ncbi:cytochrome c oxidase subunit 3 [Nocardia callitridis]|uniref:Cytochrome aa3 subunit 3 n=1 Tax=Nocardia callitridis TaxID=648753 RepID=A0ABP9KAZ4_9NOCA
MRTENAESRALPADPHLWVFVLGDLVIFSVYFVVYMIDRNRHQGAFLASQQHLHQGIGALNTVLLLASSLFVAHAVTAARAGRYRRAIGTTMLAGGCGVLFTVTKAGEWTAEIGAGHTFPSSDFFMYYYMLTGIHLFHVVLGLVFLGVVVLELRGPRKRRAVIETGAVYWHMVDLLWLLIFALLYVLR